MGEETCIGSATLYACRTETGHHKTAPFGAWLVKEEKGLCWAGAGRKRAWDAAPWGVRVCFNLQLTVCITSAHATTATVFVFEWRAQRHKQRLEPWARIHATPQHTVKSQRVVRGQAPALHCTCSWLLGLTPAPKVAELEVGELPAAAVVGPAPAALPPPSPPLQVVVEDVHIR
jgi:hypothetical protein